MPADESELQKQLHRAMATKDLMIDGDVDFHDPVAVDALCERLLKWFYLSRSPSRERDEAFGLLVQVATPLLDGAVLALRRERGVAVRGDKLVDAFFAEMYLGVGAPRIAEKAFLAAAFRRVSEVIDEVFGIVGGVDAHSTAGLALADDLVDLGGLSDDELERLERDLNRLQCAAFHALELFDRQILLCRCVDGLSEAETAQELSIPLLEVDVLCEKALACFEARKADLFDDPSLGGAS